MPEFRADFKMIGTVRVMAEDEESARRLMLDYVGSGTSIPITPTGLDWHGIDDETGLVSILGTCTGLTDDLVDFEIRE